MQEDVDSAGVLRGAVLRQVEMARTRNVLTSRTRSGVEDVAEMTRFTVTWPLCHTLP